MCHIQLSVYTFNSFGFWKTPVIWLISSFLLERVLSEKSSAVVFENLKEGKFHALLIEWIKKVSKIIQTVFGLFDRCCSTSWIQPSCTALKKGRASSCLDHPTQKETILKASPVSSSLRYLYIAIILFTPLNEYFHLQHAYFFPWALLNSFVSSSVFLISLPASFHNVLPSQHIF